MPSKQPKTLQSEGISATSAVASARRTARRKQAASGETLGRRDSILQIATRRFAAAGFEATTVRQIADEANILSGSLYHHFSTKEEMLHEVVLKHVLEQRDDARRIAALPLDAEQRLIALIGADLRRLTTYHEAFAIAFNERKRFRENALFSDVVDAKKDGYHAWHEVLNQGAREGLFSDAVDFSMTISTIIRILNMGADWYKNEDIAEGGAGVAYSFDELLDFYLGFILRSVRAPRRVNEPIVRPAQ
jgi:AcrR family transcriptional regulator